MSEWLYSALIINHGKLTMCNTSLKFQRAIAIAIAIASGLAYCAKRKKERNIEINNLKNQLETAQIGQEVGKIKDKLIEMQDKTLEGLAVRARCTKELQDERCTAYFFDRIRQRREKNNVVV